MSERRPTLVLTGATGFIGKHIAARFLEKDWHVVALVRKSPEQHVHHVLYSQHDLSSTTPLSLPDDIDAFIHAGFIKHAEGIDAFQLNTESAQQIIKAMEGKNVKQKIFLSSLSADENAASVYGRQKAAIEKLFLQENGTVIRAGLVLGNGGLFGSMRNYLKSNNKIPLFGNGQQPLQTVFIDDLVLSIEKLIAKNLNGKFVVATDTAVPYREFYKALADSLGVQPKFVRAPYWLASFGIKLATALGRKLPITKDNLMGLKQMKHISSADDLKKIGVKLMDYKESFSKLK